MIAIDSAVVLAVEGEALTFRFPSHVPLHAFGVLELTNQIAPRTVLDAGEHVPGGCLACVNTLRGLDHDLTGRRLIHPSSWMLAFGRRKIPLANYTCSPICRQANPTLLTLGKAMASIPVRIDYGVKTTFKYLLPSSIRVVIRNSFSSLSFLLLPGKHTVLPTI
jgi:hypothetical protein